MPQTIAFLGATGGCGLSTLARSLAAGHTCHALCRTPARLTTGLDTIYPSTPGANLTITQGDALDEAAVTKILVHPSDPTRLVDTIVFSIGSAFDAKRLAVENLTICADAMGVLLSVLDKLVGEGGGTRTYPRMVAISSTGISDKGRDYPLLVAPLYGWLLKGPHEDKKKMEALLRGGKGREWTLVRPMLLKDGKNEGKPIRAGVEDVEAGVVESREWGYFITRDDVGKWISENLIEGGGIEGKYLRKAVALTT